jgi:hypothetical protein
VVEIYPLIFAYHLDIHHRGIRPRRYHHHALGSQCYTDLKNESSANRRNLNKYINHIPPPKHSHLFQLRWYARFSLFQDEIICGGV